MTWPLPAPDRRSTTRVGPAGRHDGRRTRTERETSPTGAASDGDGVVVGETVGDAVADTAGGADGIDVELGSGLVVSGWRAVGALVQLTAVRSAPTSASRAAITRRL
jgi:hypothetical protein